MLLRPNTRIAFSAIVLSSMLFGAPVARGQGSIAVQIQPAVEEMSLHIVNLVSDFGGQLGLAVGVPASLGDLTLKRGTVGAMPGGTLAMSFEAQRVRGSAVTPLLAIDLGLEGAPGGGASSGSPDFAEVRVESSASVSELDPNSWPWQVGFLTGNDGHDVEMNYVLVETIDSVGQQLNDALDLSFTPSSSTESLHGRPSSYFNNPLPGEDLVLALPSLAPGTLFEEELIVYGASAEAQIRIKIKHEI